MTNDHQIPPREGLFSVGTEDNIHGTVSFQKYYITLSFYAGHYLLNFPNKKDIIGILDNGEKISLLKCIRMKYVIEGEKIFYKFLSYFAVIGCDHVYSHRKIISGISFTIEDLYALFDDEESYEEVATVIGEISVLRNKINIQFSDPLCIEKVYEKADRVSQFFGIIVGRPQNLLETTISVNTNQTEQLSVYSHKNTFFIFANYPEYPSPIPCSILINPSNNPDEFGNLISNWLRTDKTLQYARCRFFDAWGKQRSYDPDRIIAAANTFDLLPEHIFPKEPRFPKKCRHLKSKILHRLKIIKCTISNDLQEMDCRVIYAAVELRNFYVHGDKPDKRREKFIEFHRFLTDTLEFIFCVSDLINSGWDFSSWHSKTKPILHPFARYLHNYENNFNNIKQLNSLLSCSQPNDYDYFSCPLSWLTREGLVK